MENNKGKDETFENDAEHFTEEAAELAAPLAPKPGAKFAGEIKGTIEGEDVDTHEQYDHKLQPQTSES